jgi:diguanylate cyclase (GGDEF)-like protein/PAS domain S-box-containing protein
MTYEEIGAKTFAQEWLGDWGGKLTAAFGAFLIFHVAYVLFHLGSADAQSLTSNIITLIIYAGPCIAAWRASRHPNLSTRARRAWRLIALADFAFIVGTIIWMYLENYLGEQPFPSWADAGYLAFYPLMFAGLLSMVEKFRSGEERWSFVLDASIVLIGGSMVVWYFLIRPMSAAADDDTLKTVLSIAYPVGDLVLLLGICSLLLRRAANVSRVPVNFLMIGMLFNFAADFAFSYLSLKGTYATGDPVDALFTLACFPVMLAAHSQYVLASRSGVVCMPRNEPTTRNFWVPYLAVAVAYLVLLAVVHETNSMLLDLVIGVAGLVTGLVIIRQFMFLRANTKARRELTEMQERIQGIYSASTDAIGLADFEGTLNEVNDSFIRLTGFHREEIVGVMKYQYFLPDSDPAEPSAPPDAGQARFEKTLVRRDGTKLSVTTTLYPVNDAAGKPVAMAVVIRDISDRRALEEKLTFQAMHDALTGLANRALLHNRVAAAVNRAGRRNTSVSLLFLDLDNFKTVNDTMGHAAGDELLRSVSDRLRRCLRLSDTPARLGGDEFAILLEDVGHSVKDLAIAERVREAIQRPVEIDGKQVLVGASIGIARLRPFETPDDLLRNADVAMYTAKRSGKNRVAFFEDEMHQTLLKRVRLEEEMRAGIVSGEFRLKFQPIVDLASDDVVGVETLLRWDHPRGLSIGPDEFIPIAEEASLISSLGRFVMYEACDQAGRFNRDLPSDQGLALSVNVSSKQFMDDDFIDMVTDACSRGGIKPSDLIIEITENTMLNNAEATIKRLDAIKQLGIRLAIDDFGTGYSSLSYLHKFPIGLLKIDRSFIENIADSREAQAMVRAIISMSETLNLTTVAEGIENAEQAEILGLMDCQWAQGFHFAAPLDADELRSFLADRRRPSKIYRTRVPDIHSTGGLRVLT